MTDRTVVGVLAQYEEEALDALDQLQSWIPEEKEDEACELANSLRRVIRLMPLLRSVAGGTTAEVHKVFGAPGDHGYGTPLGDALHRLYRKGAA